jgi:thiamine-phosphate pyrophosphorylase
MKPLDQCSLYAFIDTAYLHGRPVTEIARQLCAGGADILQLRAKDVPGDEVLRLAEALLPVTERAGIALAINDHLEVACRVGAPVCHLGQEDFFGAGHARITDLRPTRPGLQIGLSSHAPVQAQRAVAAGAAYLGAGPIFATSTKPGAKPVALDYVRWARDNVSIPWFAIGGINLENLDAVLAAGARRICVVSAILNAPDTVKACQAFKDRLCSAAT